MTATTVVPFDFKLEPISDGRFQFSFRHQCDFQDILGKVHISGCYQAIMCTPSGRQNPDPYFWELVNEDPVTICPSIKCRNCGMHGYVREGLWVPA